MGELWHAFAVALQLITHLDRNLVDIVLLSLRVSLSAGLSSEAVQEIPAVTATTAVRLDAEPVSSSEV